MSNYENLLLNNQLCFALYAATNAIIRVYRPKLGSVGLTYPQYLVLLVLWESDGMTVKSLAQWLKLDSATITPLLKRLEKVGLLTRKRNAED
ncbi:MAG: MarR family transcriptional regulator, partial [Candidatus Dadabacteria bacterium]|nr:MarR family transcriptional regulator [Candidatus Dadabacteria bacterium]NIQ14776.1 MarR family transcriptional regulator [Candidatus Dadabacteria bacterium]